MEDEEPDVTPVNRHRVKSALCWIGHWAHTLEHPFHLLYFAMLAGHFDYKLAAVGCLIIGVLAMLPSSENEVVARADRIAARRREELIQAKTAPTRAATGWLIRHRLSRRALFLKLTITATFVAYFIDHRLAIPVMLAGNTLWLWADFD